MKKTKTKKLKKIVKTPEDILKVILDMKANAPLETLFSKEKLAEGLDPFWLERMVLERGEMFGKASLAKKLGKMRHCFGNSQRLARKEGLRYAEGFALTLDPIPLEIHHGWCVDEEGKVIETTWRKPGAAYFGMIFPDGALYHGQSLLEMQRLIDCEKMQAA